MKTFIWKYRRLGIALFYVLLLLWSINYFTTPYIKFDNQNFTIDTQDSNSIVLKSKDEELFIDINSSRKPKLTTITYKGKQYNIIETVNPSIFSSWVTSSKVYEVTYEVPTEKRFFVHQAGDVFLTYYGSGQSYPESYEQKDDERLSPRALVKATKTSLYDTKGNWFKFMLAVGFLSFGLLCIFHSYTQELMFLYMFRKKPYETMEGHRYFKIVRYEGVFVVVLALIYMYFTL